MKNIITLVLVVLGTTFTMNAQLPFDAVRFSLLNTHSTARTAGVAGAYGAIGADLSMGSYNPAGLGVYWTSEFMFSASYNSSDSDSKLLGGDNVEQFEGNTSFRLNNMGLLAHYGRDPESGWKSVNFALSYNKMANFDQSIYYEGDSKGSITNAFVESANNNSLTLNREVLAEDVGAIFLNAQGVYESDLTVDDNVFKKQTLERSGYIKELAFSLAGNYENKLMVGATLGIPFVKYRQSSTYSESFKSVAGEPLRETDLTYKEVYKVSGAGLNLKFGAIYKVNKKIRVGLAVHTPSVLTINDNYNYEMSYAYDVPLVEPGNNEQMNDPGELDYNIVTPWRTIGNFAYLFGKKGFISADVEYVNYGKSKFEIREDEFEGAKDFIRGVNGDLRAEFDKAVNLKVGGEYIKDKWRLRAGLGFVGSPFKGDNTFNSTYSVGGGIRGKSYYIDLAYSNRFLKEGFTAYNIEAEELIPDVDIESTFESFVLTFGRKF